MSEQTVDTGITQEKTEPTQVQISAENENTEGTETSNQGKTFTQDELNSIISKRLEKFKDYDELTQYKNESEESKLSEMEKLTNRITELEGYESSSKASTKMLEKVLETTLESIDTDKRSLIPKSFSLTEKLDYINKNKDFLQNSNNVNTPRDKKTNTFEKNANLIFGKYESIEDFAEQNPAEFMKSYKTKEYSDELKRLGLL